MSLKTLLFWWKFCVGCCKHNFDDLMVRFCLEVKIKVFFLSSNWDDAAEGWRVEDKI